MAGAVVQSVLAVDDSGANATTLNAVLNSVVAGNHLVSHVGWETTLSCSVSDGTAFSTGDIKRSSATNSESGQVFYRENVGSGTHTIVATFSTTTAFRRHRAYEVSGLATSSSLDQATGQVQDTPGTGANAISSSATSATTNANDFVMAFTQDTSNSSPGSGSMTAGTGYTIVGSGITMACESKSVAATGAQTATFTQSAAAGRITHVVAFKLSAASGSPYTMPTTVAAFTLTGVASALKATRQLPTVVGSFTLTGIAAGLKRGYTLAAGTGAFSLTGVAVAFKATRSLTSAVGTFALTGNATNLATQRKLAPAAASFALTGINVALTYTPVSGAFTMSAATGSFTLTGLPVAFSTTASAPVTPATGSGAGRARRQRRRYTIRIEGQIFEADSEAEAVAILAQAQSLAEVAATKRADVIVEKASPRVVSLGAVRPIAIKAPTLAVSPELQAQAEAAQQAIDKAYASASAIAELRLLLALMEAEDEEEFLLLH